MGNRKKTIAVLLAACLLILLCACGAGGGSAAPANPTAAPTSTAAPTATPQPVPKTGDSANPVLWLSLMLLGLTGIGGLTASKIRK